MQHILLIRDSVILTINWQWSGWTVQWNGHVQNLRFSSLQQVSGAVMTLIKRQSVVAKLIETSTDVIEINVCCLLWLS